MGDSRSCGLFARMFLRLAEDPSDLHKKWALELWVDQKQYDFAECELECDVSLQTLGLARPNPNYSPDGDDNKYIYGPQKQMRVPERKDLFDEALRLYDFVRAQCIACEQTISGLVQNPGTTMDEAGLNRAKVELISLVARLSESVAMTNSNAMALFYQVADAIRATAGEKE